MVSKVSKRSHGQALKPKHKTATFMTRPLQEAVKPKATISTSKVLTRQPIKEVYGKKYSKLRRSEPEHYLSLEFKDRIETSRKSLLDSSNAELERSHAELMGTLENIHMKDNDFYNNIAEQHKELFAPLEKDVVETTFTHKDGKTTAKHFQIEERVALFEATVESKKAEINRLWREWEVVQKQIVDLGIEVLGPEAFQKGSVNVETEKKGYRKEMELLDQEHEIWVKEIQKKVDRLSQEAIDKMMAAEKEIDAQQKREQANFFSKFFADDD